MRYHTIDSLTGVVIKESNRHPALQPLVAKPRYIQGGRKHSRRVPWLQSHDGQIAVALMAGFLAGTIFMTIN